MAEIVSGNQVNNSEPKSVVSRSTFPIKNREFQTMRFGEYVPHFVFEGVPKDDLMFRCSHDVKSYTLGAPLMSDIKIKKDYFCVTGEAFLPLNWDKFYMNPVRGNDVADNVGLAVAHFPNLVKDILDKYVAGLTLVDEGETLTAAQSLTRQFIFMLTAEMLLSQGSLLSNLGINLNEIAKFGISQVAGVKFFDEAFDDWINSLVENVSRFQISYHGRTLYVELENVPRSSEISLRQALEILRDEASTISSVTLKAGKSLPSVPAYIEYADCCGTVSSVKQGYPISLARVLAYQLVCAHFYTNDHIDDIYSANLYRQNVSAALTDVATYSSAYEDNTPAPQYTFTYNGVTTYYDVLSAKCFEVAVDQFVAATWDPEDGLIDIPTLMKTFYNYLRLLFGFNRSLRYQDYFTGSRSNPIAVGDTGAAVQSGFVYAVDTVRSIQRQRFFNAVNRIGHHIEEYIKGIFPGAKPGIDWHDPHWIAHTDDVVFGSEVENTGAAQLTDANSVTSTLKSNASQYAFQTDIDRPCVVIGITYFDVPRSYFEGVSRFALHTNRFDMFNPFMQFLGDQKIYRCEINARAVNDSTFGYQLRHMEYKQGIDHASGGFASGSLPGWTFLAENRFQLLSDLVINSDFIRSKASEFDQFYVDLTGWSLANYFHFIVKSTNEMDAKRDMIYAPSIL